MYTSYLPPAAAAQPGPAAQLQTQRAATRRVSGTAAGSKAHRRQGARHSQHLAWGWDGTPAQLPMQQAAVSPGSTLGAVAVLRQQAGSGLAVGGRWCNRAGARTSSWVDGRHLRSQHQANSWQPGRRGLVHAAAAVGLPARCAPYSGSTARLSRSAAACAPSVSCLGAIEPGQQSALTRPLSSPAQECYMPAERMDAWPMPAHRACRPPTPSLAQGCIDTAAHAIASEVTACHVCQVRTGRCTGLWHRRLRWHDLPTMGPQDHARSLLACMVQHTRCTRPV